MEQAPRLCRLLQGPGSRIKAAQEPGGCRDFAHTASLCLMFCCLCCCGNAGGNATSSWRRSAPRAGRWALRDSGRLAQANFARKGNNAQGENSRRKFKMDSEHICCIAQQAHRISKASRTHLRPTVVLRLGRFLTLLRFFSSITSARLLLYWVPKALLHWPHKAVGSEGSAYISHHTIA